MLLIYLTDLGLARNSSKAIPKEPNQKRLDAASPWFDRPTVATFPSTFGPNS